MRRGTSTSVTLDTSDNYNLNTTTTNDKDTTGTKTNVSAQVNGSVKAKGEAFGSSVTASVGFEVESGKEGTSGHESESGSSGQSGNITHTGTETTKNTSWNSESGYSGSKTVSNTNTFKEAITKQISEKYGYGKTYINVNEESNTQGFSSSDTESEQYSSTVTYSKLVSEEKEISYTTSNTISGYHRWIIAGTAHVFAVVGYDIKSSSFFVNTITVMDDETHQFEDYSYDTASYDDNQNGTISFTVPKDVADYVATRVCETDGLEVGEDGIINAYTGDCDDVRIPEYKVISNLDGSPNKVIKVVGINKTAFFGKTNIASVVMSDFITSIPDDAFNGCTSLCFVEAASIKSIGERAFSGCTNLKSCEIGDSVESLGKNAFDSIDNLSICASNKNVVESAIQSGANSLEITVSDKCTDLNNTTLNIANTTNKFTFNGYGKSYDNLSIKSDASKTVINRADFILTNNNPFELSSETVEFNQVSIIAPLIALELTNEVCELGLYGTVSLSSSGKDAFICKKINITQIAFGLTSKLEVSGNILMNNEDIKNSDFEDASFINYSNGEIKYITTTEFDSYLGKSNITVTFDSNGGDTSAEEQFVKYGNSFGQLPTVEKEGYRFDGWYTEKDGGEPITATTIKTDINIVNLYAHWAINTYSLVFDANGGTTSESSRIVSFNTAIGTLPNATRDYYDFDGWYTEQSGGIKVSEESYFNSYTVLYAHWELKSVSDWVLASSMPSDAQVINTMWTYTLREYSESASSTKDGWTNYDTKRTSWGSTQGPVYSNPSNGSRNVWSEQYVSSTTTHYKYYHTYNGSVWSNDYYAPAATAAMHHYIDITYELSWKSTYNSQYLVWYGSYTCPTCGQADKWCKNGTYTTNNYSTRWYYQEPVYTYYYYKDEAKETTSGDPTGTTNVSNVVKYVQYRAK